MNGVLLIVGLSLVSQVIVAYPLDPSKKYHGKYSKYTQYGRGAFDYGAVGGASGSSIRAGLSAGGFDDFDSTSLAGSALSTSLGPVGGGFTSIRRQSHISPGYSKYSSSIPYSVGSYRRFHGGFPRGSFSSQSLISGGAGLSSSGFSDGIDSISSSSGIYNGGRPDITLYPSGRSYDSGSWKSYSRSYGPGGFKSRAGGFSSGGSGLGLTAVSGFDDDRFPSVSPLSTFSASSSSYLSGPGSSHYPKGGLDYGYDRVYGGSGRLRGGGALSSGISVSGLSDSFDDGFSSISPLSSSSSSIHPSSYVPPYVGRRHGSYGYDDKINLIPYGAGGAGGVGSVGGAISSSSTLGVSRFSDFDDDGFSSSSSLSRYPIGPIYPKYPKFSQYANIGDGIQGSGFSVSSSSAGLGAIGGAGFRDDDLSFSSIGQSFGRTSSIVSPSSYSYSSRPHYRAGHSYDYRSYGTGPYDSIALGGDRLSQLGASVRFRGGGLDDGVFDGARGGSIGTSSRIFSGTIGGGLYPKPLVNKPYY